VQVGAYQGLNYLWLHVLRWKTQLACPPSGALSWHGNTGLAVHFWPKMPLGLLYASLSVPRKGRYLSPSTWWIWCVCVCYLGDAGSNSIFLVQEAVGNKTEPIYGLQQNSPSYEFSVKKLAFTWLLCSFCSWNWLMNQQYLKRKKEK
jgi:hypothetical protein